VSKAYSECSYTLTKSGLVNPRFKGLPGWPEPEGVLKKRFTGNKRQRRKKFIEFIDQCLDRMDITGKHIRAKRARKEERESGI
jgi:hypothetical protein